MTGVEATGIIEPVYNFSVDGWKTYHVGELGVWVHNTCPKPLPNLSRFEQRQLSTITKMVSYKNQTSLRTVLTMEQFENLAMNFVGKGFTEKLTSGRYPVRRMVSEDGLRQVRFPVFKSQVHGQTFQPFNSSDFVGNFQQRKSVEVPYADYGSNVHVGVKW